MSIAEHVKSQIETDLHSFKRLEEREAKPHFQSFKFLPFTTWDVLAEVDELMSHVPGWCAFDWKKIGRGKGSRTKPIQYCRRIL